MKFISTIITGAIVGAFGVYFTLDWQEEKLRFSITNPAKFGEINYQNITLSNSGWNPAINVKLYIDHPNIKFENLQSSSSLKDISAEKNGLASIERVRRDESIVFSLAYKGQPLFGTEVKIVSDRSIAEQKEQSSDGEINWLNIAGIVLLTWFAVGVIGGISIPAYRDYTKRAKEAAAKAQENDA